MKILRYRHRVEPHFVTIAGHVGDARADGVLRRPELPSSPIDPDFGRVVSSVAEDGRENFLLALVRKAA